MYQPHIVIVGAGIIGLSTALALLKQGVEKVTVLEQATVDHRQGASHGYSRLLRFEYGPDALYSEMVRLSLKHWQNLERATGKTLYTQTGVLTLGNEDDASTWSSYHTLRELGHTPERLTRRSCTERFPQFDAQHYDMFTYNTNGGMLHASTCLRTIKDCILDLGGSIQENQRLVHFNNDNKLRPIRLLLDDDEEMTADHVVLATGPWVHHLLGELRLPVRMTRQHLLYFANLPIARFGLHAFPAFIAKDLYGFPIHNTCAGSGPAWLKAASHDFGVPADPDDLPVVDEYVIQQITHDLHELIPALKYAILARVDSCIYDVSPDEDFILDYLPDDPRVVLATGLTGHSFKFGLLLGELLSNLVRETVPLVALDRFRLARFTWRTSSDSVA